MSGRARAKGVVFGTQTGSGKCALCEEPAMWCWPYCKRCNSWLRRRFPNGFEEHVVNAIARRVRKLTLAKIAGERRRRRSQ